MIHKYLLEIKYRVLFSILAWCFMMINCYYFKETLLYSFMRFSVKSNNDNLLYFLTTDVAEIFIAYIQLSYYVSNQIGAIFILCQTFSFLSAGLYLFEHIYFKTVVTFSIFFWIMLVIVFNSYIFPTSWEFFSKFQEFLSFQNLTFFFEARLKEYLTFYRSMFSLCNIIYQIVILFFIFLDLFKTNLLIIKKFRKIFYFVFFIFSTFLTPPEVVYQLITSICIIVIYELITIHMIFKTELTSFR
jgi:sec-independent protein translocase protein TatC|uniref:SecY-independent transporter protein n=1 Tax=Thalassiosira profunda TaxID=376140 RepID=A0A7T3V4C8_9STRA|nr:SecY-independent transporter protein [Thalassiosira profunda]QPZ94117.1 SecY-independent transporter protein [Thalassiosira profunda]